MEIITVVEKSRNRKAGLVSATYAPIQTCPNHCRFKDKGCYAQLGHTGIHAKHNEMEARRQKIFRPLDFAKAEAKKILELSGERPLRLHVMGDCRTPKSAEVLARAAEKYTKLHHKPVWTYTHCWREIPREKWGSISVLASCETFEEAEYAKKRGYAISMTRWKAFNKAFNWKGFKMQPCKELTEGIQCNKCQLCFKDDYLRKNNIVICFFPHGARGQEITNILKKL